MAKLNFKVPRAFAEREVPRGTLEDGHAHGRRVEKFVVERCKESGMDDVVATTRMPDGSVRVWGEAGASRPPTSRQAFEQGWERAFGGAE